VWWSAFARQRRDLGRPAFCRTFPGSPRYRYRNTPTLTNTGAMTEVVCLLDLPKELLAAVAAHLPEDDELATSLACHQLREAVVASEHRDARARVATSIAQVFGGLRPKRMSTQLGFQLAGKAGVGRVVRPRAPRSAGQPAAQPCSRRRPARAASLAARTAARGCGRLASSWGTIRA
jgi:hypothetical protein